ncbi:MAG: DUF4402 domain-containing protein [Bacteroidales bacterium]|nr:DUF4402 domain-containing protein [Bacteroidales bacterium]
MIEHLRIIFFPLFVQSNNTIGFFRMLFFVFFLTIGVFNNVFAQGSPFPPPREIRVFATQELGFGGFYTGSAGGNVIISPTGSRSATGTVVLAGGLGQPAIFIIELLPGRLVNIMISPQTTFLTRIAGGETMTMTIGPTDKGTSFVTSAGHPFRTPVQIGGTLHVGSIISNPAGEYTGNFNVTFIQE